MNLNCCHTENVGGIFGPSKVHTLMAKMNFYWYMFAKLKLPQSVFVEYGNLNNWHTC
jgi:hypothetical protein